MLRFQDVSAILAAEYRLIRWAVWCLPPALGTVVYPLGVG